MKAKIRFRLISLFAFLLLCCCLGLCVGCGNSSSQKIEYDMEICLNENTLTGKQTVSFYNYTDNAFSQLKFNLYPNAYRQGAEYSPISAQYKTRAYYNGADYGNITINGVWSENGSVLEYQIGGVDENILIVNLAEQLFPNESVKIQIDFTTTIAKVISRLGITAHTINLANFYPILCGIENQAFYESVYYSIGDPFFSESANYKVRFTTNKQMVVASSGWVESSSETEQTRTYCYLGENLRSFALVLSSDFEVLTEKVNGVSVNYYYFNDSNPKKSLQTAIKSLKYFSSTFGSYPFSTYSVVQTPFIQGGMEFSALTMISSDLEASAYEEVIIHETAHQWWQVVVGNNESEHAFLDEGLTEYSVVLFYENHPEYGLDREQLIRSSEQTYRTYCSVYQKLFTDIDTSMVKNLSKYKGEYEYVNLCYVKPCIMLDYLRTTIGENKFFAGLKNYYKDNAFKIARPEHLVASFEKNGSNVNGFFESFINGKVVI